MELLVSLINVRQFLPFYKLLVESYLSMKVCSSELNTIAVS